jgi:hypothetical protein
VGDFEDALRQRLAGNEALAAQRLAAEEEMDRVRRQAEAEVAAAAQARSDRHAALAAHLEDVAARLKASNPDRFIVRTGWTASGEELVAKISTRQVAPKRTLLVEVDRDDDEVLARWTSDVGGAVEVWRLLEVTPEVLTELVLQVADDTAWAGDRPPPFPSAG